MLPVHILDQWLNKWQSAWNKFIWGNKKPWFNANILYKSTTSEGLNVPNLKHYYIAANLTSVLRILALQSSKDWYHLEENYCLPCSLVDVFWQEKRSRSISIQECPTLMCSLAIWHKLRQKLVPDIFILSSFLNQVWFPPGNHSYFEIWRCQRHCKIGGFNRERRVQT